MSPDANNILVLEVCKPLSINTLKTDLNKIASGQANLLPWVKQRRTRQN